MSEICDEIDLLLDESFDEQRRKILDIKKDDYLLMHDVDEILSPSASLDDVIGRLRFVVFLGYKSEHLSPNLILQCSADEHRIRKEEEAKKHFESLLKELVKKGGFFESASVFVYMFPIPCIATLMSTVQEKLKEALHVA